MRPRGPLAPDTLARFLSEKFDRYLREGWLGIQIDAGMAQFTVSPPRVRLPRLLAAVKGVTLPSEPKKQVRFDLYFDPLRELPVR